MSNDNERKATVFGAGIAGLTVAHELIERGWEVEVYEPEPEPHSYTACAVGGMARTQWGRIDIGTPLFTDGLGYQAAPATSGLQIPEDARLEFAPGGWTLNKSSLAQLVELKRRIAEVENRQQATGPFLIEVRGFASQLEAFASGRNLQELRTAVGQAADDDVSDNAKKEAATYFAAGRADLLLSLLRALVVRSMLVLRPVKGNPQPRVFLIPLAMGEVNDTPARTELDTAHNYVGFNELRRPLLPGEHGYRYFPSFYHNVFDTMSRIRILEPRRLTVSERARAVALDSMLGPNFGVPEEALPHTHTDTGRTVYDNLVSNDGFEIAGEDCRPPVYLDRTDAESLFGLLAVTRDVLERRGSELSDLLRFQLRLAVYLTSGRKRRRTYEDLTWEDFLHADRCSEGFRNKLEAFPKALVGLSSSKADARSMGTITVQLLLDQLRETRLRDASLNGPTSVAWLDPWKHYLTERRVKFHRGALTELRFATPKNPKALSLEAVVTVTDLKGNPIERTLDQGYLVVALPITDAKRLCAPLLSDLPKRFNRRFRYRDIRRIATFRTEDALTDFTGVQFYLKEPLFAGVSHTYYQDATWGLSSIMQSNLWIDQRAYRGEGANQLYVLSVDVTELDRPGPIGKKRKGKSARACSKEEFAAEVWAQVSDGLKNFGWEPNKPYAWHIDDSLVFDAGNVTNRTPYLVNLAGEWQRRPGTLVYNRRRLGYEVHFDRLVFAGSYMKTHTRITTMESANESGRHAVNGLLRHQWYAKSRPRYRFNYYPCPYRPKTKVLREALTPPGPHNDPAAGKQLAARQRAIADGVLANYASIHDPESNEPPDLHWLKALDDRLCTLHMPHLFEILELEAWIDAAEPDPAALMDVLHRLSTLGLDPSASLPQLLSSLWSAWRSLRR